MRNTLDEFHVLKRLSILGVLWIVNVIWKVPPSSWIKVNTDSATFGSLSLSLYMSVFQP